MSLLKVYLRVFSTLYFIYMRFRHIIMYFSGFRSLKPALRALLRREKEEEGREERGKKFSQAKLSKVPAVFCAHAFPGTGSYKIILSA